MLYLCGEIIVPQSHTHLASNRFLWNENFRGGCFPIPGRNYQLWRFPDWRAGSGILVPQKRPDGQIVCILWNEIFVNFFSSFSIV